MKEKHTYSLIIVLVLGISVSCCDFSFGQNVLTETEGKDLKHPELQLLELLSEDLDSTQLSFIKEQNYLSNVEIGEVLPFESLRGLFSEENKSSRTDKRIQSTVTLQNIYVDNFLYDSILNTKAQLYSNVLFSNRLDVAGIPISVGGRLVGINGQTEKKLSRVYFSFDSPQFLEKSRQDLMLDPTSFIRDVKSNASPIGLPGYIDIFNNSPTTMISEKYIENLSSADKEVIKNEIKFQIYQKIITDPSFIKLVSNKDSLEHFVAKREVEMKNLEENQKIPAEKVAIQKNKLEELLTNYQQSWEKRKTYYGDSLNQIQEKLVEQSNEILELQDSRKLRRKILTKKDISFGRKILAATEKMNIGQALLEDSWYTVKSQPIVGGQYAFDLGNLNGEIAYGKQVFNTNVSPLLHPRLFNNLNGGKIFYGKLGYSFSEKTEVAYSITNIQDPGNFSQGLILPPQSNTVFAFSGSTQMSSNLGLKTEFALSRTSWGLVDLNNDRQLSPRNLAGESTITCQLLNNRMKMEAGYFYVGPEYIALANPFLQNNRQGLISKLDARISNRLMVRGEFRLGKSVDKNIVQGGDFKNVQVLGSFNWRPFKDVSVSGQISPNTFKQNNLEVTDFSGSNTLYNLQVNAQKKLDELVLVSIIGLTNFNSRLTFADTSLVNRTEQIFLQNSLMFQNRTSISAILMIGVSNEKSFENGKQKSFFSQLDYEIEKDEWRFRNGIQFQKDPITQHWLYGFDSSGEFRLSKSIRIGLVASFLLPVSVDTKSGKRFLGRLDLTKQF